MIEKAAAVEGNTIEITDHPTKHPLQNSWTWWFFKEEKNKDWIECYQKVASFNTVEDFWQLHNYIYHPSKIELKCEYAVFKEGIMPMWEDASNCKGGKWRYTVQLKHNGNIDTFWK